MNQLKFQYASLFLAVLFLTACSGQVTVVPTASLTATDAPPTATPTPIPTLTPTPSPTPTSTLPPTPSPTPTSTLPPTETSIPLPASLLGTISLSGENVTKPIVGAVELREAETFDLIVKGDINSKGEYKIEDLEPGKYELWILFATKPVMVSGCRDIRPPGDSWKLGINFDGDKALTMEAAYLSKALLLVEGLQGTGLKAIGFYAVLSDFEIVSGIENEFDVTLFCD